MPAYIDLPDGEIHGHQFTCAGWIATNAVDARIALRVDGRAVPFTLYDRPDVRAAPELKRFLFTSGIVASVTLATLPDTGAILLELACEHDIVEKQCRIAGSAAAARAPPDPERALCLQARTWCEAHLRCPDCGAPGDQLSRGGDAIACAVCHSVFPQDTAGLNMISLSGRRASGIKVTENVSSNPYTPDALTLIETTVARGGWVLDCGAGARPHRLSHVINTEIVDYESTDVLAVGESLPFADASFDAVLTLAVLEHVRDPFACAREIVRVLKPGGEILADVPFLQPLHGYPDHYYNMTQAGLIHLFADACDVIECRVPLHGHPIFGVQWLLGLYLAGLPETARAQFASMTIGEAASIVPHMFLTDPAAAVAIETQNAIGCLNSLRIRKRQDEIV